MKYFAKGLSFATIILAAALGTGSETPCAHPTAIVREFAVSAPVVTHASWYGPGFFGRHTSSGKIYAESDLLVANRTIPFGTKLKVTNLRNHRSIVVAVEDRGPYFHPRRGLDLSYSAAKQLDMISAGVVPVSYSQLTPKYREGGLVQ